MTNEQVAEMLIIIQNTYQNFRVDEGVIKAWIMIFSDYEYEPIMASLKKYIKSGEYCPVPASIIKIYEDGKAKLDKSISDNIYDLNCILTTLLGRSDVYEETEYYKRWLKSKPEMYRMGISNRAIKRLKQYGNEHYGEQFDFKKWLENQEKGD